MAVPGLTSLLPPIRETAAMLLFERLPDSIFAPLASTNRRRYWAMLCYLHERYFGPNAPLPPSNGFNMTEIVHAIEDELLTQDAWDSEEGEAQDEPETPLAIRANGVFSRLRDTGWLRVEQFARDQMVTMRPIVSKFLDELVAFAETGPVFVSGKIRSIDLNIQQVVEGKADGATLTEAAEQARHLLEHIRNTGTNIRDLMKDLNMVESTAAYVHRFFNDYVERVFIGDYRELRTREHPLSRRPQILRAVEEIASSEVHRKRLVAWYEAKRCVGNGSGKSSAIDAIQIAMFGANSRLAALNAQADDKVATTRTIRAYCLGQYGVSEEDRARDHATTYITLLWRNSETNEPLSMGVCLLASADREGHEVQGRYIIRGVELSMSDHIETVDGKERPRAWATFRHQLIERSKVTGEDPLYTDAERYIKAALLALRGDGAAPSYEAFTRAFRFGLRMSFNKTVDQIVRNEVLESRPTNIKKFKEVTESFRRLAELVAHVEKKIADGERVEVNFAKAAEASVQAVTWDALSKDAALESAVDAMNQASKNSQEAVEALHELETEQQTAEQELVKAKNNALEQQRLRESHSAHKDYGALQTEIKQATGIASQKSREMSESISLIRRTLTGASVSPFLQPDAVRLPQTAKSVPASVVARLAYSIQSTRTNRADANCH